MDGWLCCGGDRPGKGVESPRKEFSPRAALPALGTGSGKSAPVEAHGLRSGDAVDVRVGGSWHKGRVDAINQGGQSFEVSLEDDTLVSDVAPADLCRREALAAPTADEVAAAEAVQQEEQLRAAAKGAKPPLGAGATPRPKVAKRILHCRAVRAANIRDEDTFSKSDPFFKVTVGAQEAKSKRIDDNLNPEWNEDLEPLLLAPGDDTLQLAVFDYDPGATDDLLGCVDVEVASLPVGETVKLKKELHMGQPKPGLKSTCGEVEVELRVAALEQVGSLRVRAMRGKNLRDTDAMSKSDPFLKVALKSAWNAASAVSSVVQDSLDPDWGGEDLEPLPLYACDETVFLSLWDEDSAKTDDAADELGHVEVPVSRLKPNTVLSLTEKVHSRLGAGAGAAADGEVEVEMLLDTR